MGTPSWSANTYRNSRISPCLATTARTSFTRVASPPDHLGGSVPVGIGSSRSVHLALSPTPPAASVVPAPSRTILIVSARKSMPMHTALCPPRACCVQSAMSGLRRAARATQRPACDRKRLRQRCRLRARLGRKRGGRHPVIPPRGVRHCADAVIDTVGEASQGQLFGLAKPGSIILSSVSPPSADLARQHDGRAAEARDPTGTWCAPPIRLAGGASRYVSKRQV